MVFLMTFLQSTIKLDISLFFLSWSIWCINKLSILPQREQYTFSIASLYWHPYLKLLLFTLFGYTHPRALSLFFLLLLYHALYKHSLHNRDKIFGLALFLYTLFHIFYRFLFQSFSKYNLLSLYLTYLTIDPSRIYKLV